MGAFHARIDTIKDRNGKDPIEAEEIKKRWQEYTEELCKKSLLLSQWPNDHNAVVTYLEPDILQYEVKWALRSNSVNKASGGDRIPAELFQILKDDAVKVLHSKANLENSVVAAGLEKVSFYPNSKEGQCWKMFELPYNCAHLAHTVMLKILQARLQ